MDLVIKHEVKEALVGAKPVVALESTLITHGLPAPVNLEVARALEAEVRAAGATPATVAILRGQITVGLADDQLVELAESKDVRKCSRRDLPAAVAGAEYGATTVATTMWVAHRAGIKVFATGGIGGVHRGHPFDVSADLIEMGRTPVAVVCAGAKAILDLPLTLEVLETHGVPVIGYGTDSFPAFYTRESGLPVTVRCDTPVEVARILLARDEMGLTAAVLVANPISEQDELPSAEADVAIATALQEAEQKGIRGKDVTPFLLGRVSELTGEASQRANIALLKNNARLAAEVAKALSGQDRNG